MNFHFKNALLLLFIGAMTVACDKNKQPNQVIPLVQVNLTLYVNDPSFIDLATPGGWEYVTGGSRGIVIYRITQDEFVAFDRHCPYDADNPCGRVAVDDTQVAAVDTCCGSSFLIIDGGVLEGPAAVPLQAYQTTFDGQILRVFN